MVPSLDSAGHTWSAPSTVPRTRPWGLRRRAHWIVLPGRSRSPTERCSFDKSTRPRNRIGAGALQGEASARPRVRPAVDVCESRGRLIVPNSRRCTRGPVGRFGLWTRRPRPEVESIRRVTRCSWTRRRNCFRAAHSFLRRSMSGRRAILTSINSRSTTCALVYGARAP